MKSLIKRFYSSGTAVRAVIWTADILFLASLLIVFWLWWEVKTTITLFGHTLPVRWNDNRLLIPLAALALHGVAAYGAEGLDRARRLGIFRFPITARLVMLYVAIMGTIMIADNLLKHTKVEFQVAPLVLVSKNQGVEHFHKSMLADPDLVWKFEPGSSVFGGKINSLGFRDREVSREKAPGVRRVICMGDSVTAQGQPCYAQYLNQMLTNAPPDGGKWEALSMGVYGYSSMQGLRSFELLGKSLKPDVVIVSFGRNDHVWEVPDRTRLGARLSPGFRSIYTLLSNRTVGRLFLHVMDVRHQWTATKPKVAKADTRELRLPPEDFRLTMRQFVKEIREAGATPILVAAARRRIPEDYVTKGCARTRDEFERQHDEYAQIVRDVAKETDTTLVDLQKLMAGPECDGWFASDAIHLDFYESEGGIEPWSREQPGLRFVARTMYNTISNLPPAQSSHKN